MAAIARNRLHASSLSSSARVLPTRRILLPVRGELDTNAPGIPLTRSVHAAAGTRPAGSPAPRCRTPPCAQPGPGPLLGSEGVRAVAQHPRHGDQAPASGDAAWAGHERAVSGKGTAIDTGMNLALKGQRR